MKRLICILLCPCLFLLFACSRPESTFTEPVYFYYPRLEVNFEGLDGVIAYEIREGKDFSSVEEFLESYLQGPESYILYSPFPVTSTLIDCSFSESCIRVSLSNDFDQLVGIPFTIATSCIAKTLFSYTKLKTVEINILNIDNTIERSVTLTNDHLLLEDSYAAPPAE